MFLFDQGSRRRNDQQLEEAVLQTARASIPLVNPRIMARLLKRVIEVLQDSPEYRETQSNCQEWCAYCPRICARADLNHRHCRCYIHQMEDMNERAEQNKRQRIE